MDVSIIIVNWNTKKLLKDCLSSVFKFTKAIKYEVIVVDNASADGSAQMVLKKFPYVKLIRNKQNFGFGKANNQGIKIAKGKYIMLLNSDAYLIENSLEKLFKKAESIKNLGILAPQITNEDKSIQQSAGFFPNLPQVFFWMSFLDDLPFGQIFKPYHIDHDSFYQNQHNIDWATAAAILISKEALKKTSGFDENIFMYGEEVELAWRIKNSGFQVIYTPFTKIVHIGRGSSQNVSKAAFIGEYSGIKYFYKKHKKPISLQIVRFLLKIGALGRILIFGLLGRRELSHAYVEAFKMA